MLLASLGWGSLAWIFFGVAALGGALEIAQAMVGCGGEWGDFAANDLGALAGLAVGITYLALPRRLVEPPRRG